MDTQQEWHAVEVAINGGDWIPFWEGPLESCHEYAERQGTLKIPGQKRNTRIIHVATGTVVGE